jgi:UDP-N-acetylglucosamine--N-acetylmuramyl-(pentapeptide) pyrophosphoryl-undecaprenol N-acetylglucosamine transferase
MNVCIAGGGTGGHLFPGIALAQEFARRDPQTNILFIGVAHGIEARTLPGLGYRLATVSVRGVRGTGLLAGLGALARVPAAVIQAARILKRHRTDIVVGMGGYSAFPALSAGRCMRIPTAIHEQNSVPGLTNRVLGVFADRVFLSFEESRPFFPAGSARCCGLPVRYEFLSRPAPARDARPCLFICGGSQGARQINRAVMEALEHLGGLRSAIRFVHQTGTADVDEVQRGYARAGCHATVQPFFDDMHGCYCRAHLVIARAGAGTLAEIALCGRASVLIPYPHAANDHQAKNAAVFARRGAARVLTGTALTGAALAETVRDLLGDHAQRRAMEEAAEALARPHAAADIVDACRDLLHAAQRGGGAAPCC